MTMFPYLSTEWQQAAERIRDRYSDRVGTPEVPLVVNVTVTGVPFGSDSIELHSLPGIPNVYEPGHVDDAPVSIGIGYQLARLVLLDPGTTVLQLAFDSGQITVEGDADRVSEYWRTHIGNDAYVELMDQLRAITK